MGCSSGNSHLSKCWRFSITCSGLRSGDAALRFKYAGFDEELIRVEDELEAGLQLV